MTTTFIFNEERCVGCGACTVACMDQKDITDARCAFRTVTANDAGALWHFTANACAHCADAPCIAACPAGCILRDEETGLVLADNSGCIGCKSCARACPHGAPRFTEQGKMVKCDGCVQLVRAGLTPPCVKVCPHRALSVAQTP